MNANVNGFLSAAAHIASAVTPVPPMAVSPTNGNCVRRSDLRVDNGCFGAHIAMNTGGQLSELQTTAPAIIGFPAAPAAAQCAYFQGAVPEFVGHGFDAANGFIGASNVYDAAALSLVNRVPGFSPPFEKWRRCVGLGDLFLLVGKRFLRPAVYNPL